MDKKDKPLLSCKDIRRMQEIEGNPFTSDDEAMFAMFERKGWSAEQRLSYIKAQFSGDGAHAVAE